MSTPNQANSQSEILLKGLRPSAKRSLALFHRSLFAGDTAFLIGAGFDIALNKESNNWSKLIKKLLIAPVHGEDPASSDHEAGIKDSNPDENTITQWPTELALWASCRYETQTKFKDRINTLVKVDPSQDNRFGCLLAKPSIIVTTNYSDSVEQIVKKQIAKLNKEDQKNGPYKYFVLDREDLPGFDLREAISNKKHRFIIHLHGRCSPRSNPILDAWGYNVISNEDVHYVSFLKRLFTSFNVMSFGVSWSDLPLRNAAGYVRRTRGYVGRDHVSIQKAKHEHQAIQRDLINAMRASYGVHPIYLDEPEIIFDCLSKKPSEAPESAEDNYESLVKVASFFDNHGDYESPQHLSCLNKIGNVNNNREKLAVQDIRKGAETLASVVDKYLKQTSDWELAARIERHLRHHLYLYSRPSNCKRKNLLKMILNVAIEKDNNGRELSPDILFDLQVGLHELGVRNLKGSHPLETLDKLVKNSHLESKFTVRLQLAEMAWGERAGTYPDLPVRLLDVGWESLAAKVIGDLIKRKIKEEEGLTRFQVLEMCERMATIARGCGATRRLIKSEIIASFWDPDPHHGRQRIMNAIRRTASPNFTLEPALYNGLVAGFIVAHLQFNKRASVQSIGHEFDSLLHEAGIDKIDLDFHMLAWWQTSGFMHNDLQRDFEQIIKDMRPKP